MIAYQGHPGAYSHLACQQIFPDGDNQGFESFVDAMLSVEQGHARAAVIPVENTSAGRVEEIWRLIPKMSLHITGEHFEPVMHYLMAGPRASLETIHTVISHPQALAQCEKHIRLLSLQPAARLDTAGAALEVSQTNDPAVAAIASALAAEIYNLTILKPHFQDQNDNTTRFIILSKTRQLPDLVPEQDYLTSVLFRVRNIPAALYKALGGFATNGVNLIKLESYQSGSTLSISQFHVDIAGHPEEPGVALALQELAFFADDIRMMGTYPAHPFRHQWQFRDG